MATEENHNDVSFVMVTRNGKLLHHIPEGEDPSLTAVRKPQIWTPLLRVFLAVCVILFLSLVITIVVHVYSVRNLSSKLTHSRDSDYCLSRQCIQLAAQVLSYMDDGVDPCNDFYQYSCGGWFKKNIIPESKAQWDIFQELLEARNNVLRSALENQNPVDKAMLKLFAFYKSCLNESALEEIGFSEISKVIRHMLGGSLILDPHWNDTSWNWLRMLQKIELMASRNMYMFKVVPFLDSKVTADIVNSTVNIIEISPPELGIFDPANYFAASAEAARLSYKNSMKEIMEIFGVSEENATKFSEEIFELETTLARIIPKASDYRNIQKINKRVTIAELNEETEGKFDWIGYLSKVMKCVGKKINPTDLVAVRSMSYMKEVVNIILSTPKHVIANYFSWTVILNNIDALPVAVQKAHFEYQRTISGVQVDKSRWEKCLEKSETLMGMALGALFVQEKFDMATKDDVESIIEQIKDAFVNDLNKIQWMDEETKIKAKRKAQAMIGNIAFPVSIMNPEELSKLYDHVTIEDNHYLRNVFSLVKNKRVQNLRKIHEPVDREEWVVPPTLVNAFYDPVRNKMVFLAGVLQPPFYSWKGPKAMNFGGIGMVMGHELTHGFDDQGRLYDEKGDLSNWWSNFSAQNFQKNAECMIDQYSNYSIFGAHVNGELTLGENIADNGGLKTSFNAYKKWQETHGADIKLPGVNLTNEQLFFLTSAQIWCSLERKQAVVQSLNTEAHSPGIYRVVGMLSNSHDFGKTFNCRPGTRMNPRDKCSVW